MLRHATRLGCFFMMTFLTGRHDCQPSAPRQFWSFWERHVQAVTASEVIFQQVKDLHLAVGRRQVQSSINETGEPAAAPVRQTRECTPCFELGSWHGKLMPVNARLYGPALTQKLSMARLALIWVSFTQLYLDFHLTWGHTGPFRVRKQWIDAHFDRECVGFVNFSSNSGRKRE